jgi:hypothetical protein
LLGHSLCVVPPDRLSPGDRKCVPSQFGMKPLPIIRVTSHIDVLQAGAAAPKGTRAPGTADDPAQLLTTILAAYRDILGIDSVPLTASFFTLGGSSVDAVLLCARIGEHVGMPISGADFMKRGACAARWTRPHWTAPPRTSTSPRVEAYRMH